jgi:mono/diheme cytochrome c family protein
MFLKSAVAFMMVVSTAMAVPSAGPLVWESPNQTNKVKANAISTKFIFKVRNVSTNEVVVDDLKTSCGCTVAQLPSNPWRIAPKQATQFEAIMDLRGKYGKLFKQIDVVSTNAAAILSLTIEIEPGTNSLSTQMQNRLWGQQLAATDHQAVFKKQCVNCHLTPAFGKSGEPLYHAVCGVCHEAEHRATMVPDLRALNTEIGTNYWREWVTNGKPGTLMPAFTSTQGGPLDDAQINSLVKYLTTAFPRPPKKSADSSSAKPGG